MGFCLLKLLITALFSPAHTEPRKMADTTAMAVNIPRGFRNLQGSDTAVRSGTHAHTHTHTETGQLAQPSGHLVLLQNQIEIRVDDKKLPN